MSWQQLSCNLEIFIGNIIKHSQYLTCIHKQVISHPSLSQKCETVLCAWMGTTLTPMGEGSSLCLPIRHKGNSLTPKRNREESLNVICLLVYSLKQSVMQFLQTRVDWVDEIDTPIFFRFQWVMGRYVAQNKRGGPLGVRSHSDYGPIVFSAAKYDLNLTVGTLQN